MTRHSFKAAQRPHRPDATFGAVCIHCGEGVFHENHDPVTTTEGTKMGKTKLSATQLQTLRAMAQHPRQLNYVPTGYRGAGPDASRWYRTIDALERAQLVRRHVGTGYARLILPAPAFVFARASEAR